MKRNYLLPHRCQRIGIGLLLAALVPFCACCIAGTTCKSPGVDIDVFVHRASMVSGLMMCIAVVLITFSCEKYEDEMIDSVRKSSVVTVAYILFLVYIAITMLRWCFNTDFIDHSGNTVSLTADLRDTLCHPLLFFFYYEIVFRRRLAKFRKALNNEE